MKRLILVLAIILMLPSICLAQGGLINPDQINSHTTLAAQAGENISAFDIVRCINDSGVNKCYKINKTNAGVTVSSEGTVAQSVKLDSTHTAFAYVKNSTETYSIVGKFNSATNDYTFGSPVKISGARTISQPKIAALDSTHYVIIGGDGGDSNKGYMWVISVSSETTITSGSESQFINETVYNPNVSGMDSTHFVLNYRLNSDSNTGYCKVGVTDGNTTVSSYGTHQKYSGSTPITRPSVVGLSGSSFVALCLDNTPWPYCVAASVSGTTINSYGSFNPVETDSSNQIISAEKLSSSSFALARFDGSASKVETEVGTVSGTTITINNTVADMGANTSSGVLSVIDSTHYLVTCVSGASTAVASQFSISGTTPSKGTTISYSTNVASSLVSIAALSTTKSGLFYQEDTALKYYIGTSDGTNNMITYGLLLPTNKIDFLATETKTSGNQIQLKAILPYTVYYNPSLALTPATQYFVSTASILTTTDTPNSYVGYSLDTNSIYFDAASYNQEVSTTCGVSLQRR